MASHHTGAATRAKGVAITAIGVLALSPDSLVIRLLSVDRRTILMWRGVLMGLGLITIYWIGWARGRLRAELAAVPLSGLLAAVFFASDNVLFVTAIFTTSVANTLLILSAAPVFAALLERVLLGEVATAWTWLAIGAVGAGVVLILSGSGDPGHLLGDLAAVGAALSIAGTLVIIRRSKAANMMPAVAAGALIAAAVALPLADPTAPRGGDIALLAASGLIMLPAAFGLIALGPRYLRAHEVGLLMVLETVFGPLWVWLALGEVPPARTFAGGALILGALVLYFHNVEVSFIRRRWTVG